MPAPPEGGVGPAALAAIVIVSIAEIRRELAVNPVRVVVECRGIMTEVGVDGP